MIIVAKFASVCPKCDIRIEVGEKVQWEKGYKAAHITCPAASPKPKAEGPRTRASRTPSVADAPYVREEKWAPCRRAALPDTTGDVRVATAPPPGIRRPWAEIRKGADANEVREGDALVVVGQTARYESAEENEDCGDMTGPAWWVTLYLRRATDEEAAPARARYAAKRAAETARVDRVNRVRELTRLCLDTGMLAGDDAARKPAGREYVIDPGVNGSGVKIAVLSEDGQGAAIWAGGHYDDYRPTLAVTRDPRAAEILRALLGVAS